VVPINRIRSVAGKKAEDLSEPPSADHWVGDWAGEGRCASPGLAGRWSDRRVDGAANQSTVLFDSRGLIRPSGASQDQWHAHR